MAFASSSNGHAYEFPSCKKAMGSSARQIPLYRRSNQIIVVSRGPIPKLAKSYESKRISPLGIGGVRAAATVERATKQYPGEEKGFVEEMRHVAMRLHTRDVAKEGTKEPDAQPIGKWEPTMRGYLCFLVDSKLVYDTLEDILHNSFHQAYAEFRNTGLER